MAWPRTFLLSAPCSIFFVKILVLITWSFVDRYFVPSISWDQVFSFKMFPDSPFISSPWLLQGIFLYVANFDRTIAGKMPFSSRRAPNRGPSFVLSCLFAHLTVYSISLSAAVRSIYSRLIPGPSSEIGPTWFSVITLCTTNPPRQA